jgi:hypothetical protein
LTNGGTANRSIGQLSSALSPGGGKRRDLFKLCKPHHGQIMKSSIEHRHTFDGDVEIQLTGSSVSVTDSKLRDSVSIHGIDALTLLKAKKEK